MAGNSGFGRVNYFLTGTISASSSEASLGPSNLSGQQVNAASGWQTPNGIVTGATLVCTFPTAGTIVRAVGLFGTNLTGSAVVTVDAFLTSGPTLVSTLTIGGPQTGYGQVVGIFSSNVTADYMRFTINDSTNPDNHINVGGGFCGPMWFPQTGISWNTTYGENVARNDFRARGGPRFISHLYTERFWKIAFDSVRGSEAWDDLAELKRIAAFGTNILFVPDQTDVDLNRMAIFGVIETQSDVSFPYKTTDARAVTLQITERL